MIDVSAAASNVLDKVLRGGVADLRPTPRSLVDRGPNRWVYRMAGDGAGDPVLLVPPLAAPALCFDLRRGCSLAEHLVQQGLPTYLVDYGTVRFSDRGLGIEHWIDEVLPRTIRTVSQDAGGRPVHIVAWCLGGILSLLTTADRADLPIASITTVASPIDFTAIPLVAPARPLIELTGGWLLTAPYRLLGGAPRQIVRWAFQLTSVDKYVTRPLAMLTHLDDKEFLAQIEAVDRFTENMIAYPGRTFGQLYHRFFRGNDLHDGIVDVDGRLISLSRIEVPVLVIAGATDGIAPEPAVRRVTRLLGSSPEVRFEVCPGGHLGVLTGRGARDTTWQVIDSFLAAHRDQ
ncbi:alpha/beta fold hydrolase [Kibdelosporangium persicum]|uniref:Poly-beta-hydroxybutyrate polymerase n=1 Tax=Kibdelosporangium persicum TaxID=2698649 RepID=A0ABX2FGL5_9PSEU|nr:alpha/beta fold hydrolase [Kibdelosporangium persicum]NRN70259.1 Poly-beta-hydroxybutyrate polymerase [Kibdelosporangium persicum]